MHAAAAVGSLGLSLLLAGARRTSRRGRLARHETDVVSQDRDHLAEQQRGNVNADSNPTDRRDWRHPFGHRSDCTATSSTPCRQTEGAVVETPVPGGEQCARVL
ncbi:hypothetical protein COO55_10025 [Rhodococcus opacus]|nr:hypothetical protein COO55_10025 [Rhodococcus opacus]